jgi:hypothetical protein
MGRKNKSEEIDKEKSSAAGILPSAYPLYTEDSSIDDMNKNNHNFYEEISRKAFETAFKEEEDRLNKLVKTTYHPKEKEEELSDFQLMKKRLNLIT